MLTLTAAQLLGKSTFLLTAGPPNDRGGMLVIVALMFSLTMIMLGLLRVDWGPDIKIVAKGLAAFALGSAFVIMLVVAFAMST